MLPSTPFSIPTEAEKIQVVPDPLALQPLGQKNHLRTDSGLAFSLAPLSSETMVSSAGWCHNYRALLLFPLVLKRTRDIRLIGGKAYTAKPHPDRWKARSPWLLGTATG